MGHDTQGFAALSPAQRSLAAALGSLTRWSRINTVEARQEATAAARAARQRAWEKQADPDGTLPAAELAAAVDRLKRAHYARMGLASAKSRSRNVPAGPAPFTQNTGRPGPAKAVAS